MTNECKIVTKKASQLREMFSHLGRDQGETGARVGGAQQWELSSILASIEARGWDDMAGPMPLYRVGDTHPRIGNRRLTALMLLCERVPAKWTETKFKVREYPEGTPDAVMDEIVANEIRSTKAHTRRDIVALICKFKQRNPNASQRDCANHVGPEILRNLNTFKDGALELGPDGILRIKPNLSDAKVFRQKDVIMEGIAAAKALPEVRDLFLNPTEARYLNADELYAANQAFEADLKQKPSLSQCSTMAEIAESFPASAVVAQVGPVLVNGRDSKPGSKPGGKRALSTAGKKALQQTLGKFGPVLCLFQHLDGLPGAQGEKALESVERQVEILARLANPSTPDSEVGALRAELRERVSGFQAAVDAAAAELAAQLKQ